MDPEKGIPFNSLRENIKGLLMTFAFRFTKKMQTRPKHPRGIFGEHI